MFEQRGAVRMHEKRPLAGGAAHQVVEQGRNGAEIDTCPAEEETHLDQMGLSSARLRWTLTTKGCSRESTAMSLAVIAGMADWDVSVNSPERRNPKNTRQDAAHSRRASYWSPPATDHKERRCSMTEAVMGRCWLLARDWECWIPLNVYGRRGHLERSGAGSPALTWR